MSHPQTAVHQPGRPDPTKLNEVPFAELCENHVYKNQNLARNTSRRDQWYEVLINDPQLVESIARCTKWHNADEQADALNSFYARLSVGIHDAMNIDRIPLPEYVIANCPT